MLMIKNYNMKTIHGAGEKIETESGIKEILNIYLEQSLIIFTFRLKHNINV